MPEQHRHLANKCENIVNLQGRRHVVSPRAQLVELEYVACVGDGLLSLRAYSLFVIVLLSSAIE